MTKTKILCPYCKRFFTISLQDMGKLMGKSGGKKTLTRHGRAFFAAIGKKGLEKRWGKHKI